MAAERIFPEAGSNPGRFLAALINLLEELKDPAVLVLDDLHLIDNPEIHQELTFLLEHLPPALTLVIATRADPALPLAGLRARGAMAEIRQEQLALTTNEAGVFLNQAMDLKRETEQIEVLNRRTEGWIAGLQLAGLSLKGEENPEPFIDTFSGSHRYIMDYLVEEVLLRQPPEIQDFLAS